VKQIVIIGGGVAGLSALNSLADLGMAAVLIEGGEYPAHKVCGEFISPESLPILANWNIYPPAEINRISLTSNTSSLSFALFEPAKSYSRYDFDLCLANRAREKGSQILTKTQVIKIEKNRIHLDNGEVVFYSDLIVSAGRFFGRVSPPQYYGIKGHLQGLSVKNHLEMFPFKGGYAGLSPIDDDYANFACLIHKSNHTLPTPLQSVFYLAPQLEKRLESAALLFKEWMVCPVPAFGMKKTASLANTYFIGDAGGTIPPASGLGLSLAITSGYMVAEYALKGDYLSFQKAWKKKYRKVFYYGQCLHRMMMNPILFHSGIEIGKIFPKMAPQLFKKTRY